MQQYDRNNFRFMDKKIKEIAYRYKKMKIQLQNSQFVRFKESDENGEENAKKFVEFIDSVLNTLTKEERILIENDYFKNEDYMFWWMSYYSRSSYYRKKKSALIKFLDIARL